LDTFRGSSSSVWWVAHQFFPFSPLTPGTAPESLAADSKVYYDTETGFTFSSYGALYALGKYITYRTAVPNPANTTAFDIVVQVTAPLGVGWAGLAWGGGMLNDPLAVSWQSGSSVVVSSRYST
jgi:hypothetical protein